MPNRRVHAVVNALNVDAEKPLEISFRRSLDRTDVRNARVVHENIQMLLPRQFVEDLFRAAVIRNVAFVGLRIPAGRHNFLRRNLSCFLLEINDAHRRALLREPPCDGPPDAAGSSGNNSYFAVEPESIAMLRGAAQRETPRFQGMKSF